MQAAERPEEEGLIRPSAGQCRARGGLAPGSWTATLKPSRGQADRRRSGLSLAAIGCCRVRRIGPPVRFGVRCALLGRVCGLLNMPGHGGLGPATQIAELWVQ